MVWVVDSQTFPTLTVGMMSTKRQGLAMRLSPTSSYYICKLLRHNINNLKWIVAPGAGLQAEPWGNLDAVLNSLYLEEPEVANVTTRLESLATYHRTLVEQTLQSTDEITAEMNRIEATIFWLLGFKLSAVYPHCSLDKMAV